MAVTVDRWMLPGELARADEPGEWSGTRTPRDWAVDVTMFAVAALVWFLEFRYFVLPNVLGLPSWTQVADAVLGGIVCLALWWRRRFPVTGGVLAATAGALANTAAAAMILLLFSLALHRGWKPAVPITSVAVLISVPYIHAYFPGASAQPLPWLISLVLGAALVVTAGIGVRARRQVVLALRMRADAERRAHGRALEESRLAERQRIAREMHDVLAHRISLLAVHAGALEYRTAQAERGAAPEPTAAEVRDVVAVVRSNANQALDELREVLDLLRQPPDGEDGREAPQPTVARLPALVDEARLSGQQVRADFAEGLEELRPQLQRTIYRIVQEGLTNARKHAPGAAVDVVVSGSASGEVLVQVANAAPIGVTTSEIPGAGAGLIGLAERIALHGGELSREISDGKFRVRARIPCAS
ncbi:sensor histidine kinase [Amycolatopsis roodepoortensis]|uniref:histidine kinase n=1 Tax=Amycolatopsis roodepoortensis TaxID=700274 RepID=A0ABR9L3G2_9PSEU|nr:histidine kinase [Amycolatopsis roodepoortensis]MBE1574676.1 signal transduction histidine kinase [Amycolatopsis roodepoortensis]